MNDDGLFVFVLMPFDTIFDDIYKLGIKESATNLGLRAERVDEQKYSEGVLDRIYRQIDLADIIIADMTGQNPNVFYEVGYAHAKEKLCILLTSSANDIPFDLKHRRHIVYDQSISKLKTQLSEDLIWARNIIKDTQKSHIQVNIKRPSGAVEKDRWTATGRVDFKIVLSNESTKPSPEIEAAYFYSTKDWSLFQDGNECPSTDSDIPEFNKQHFLKLPVRRLSKKAWAQLIFYATKTLASAYKGEELESSYRITGRSILRLVTSEGTFDHTLLIDVMIDDIPF